MYEAIWENPSDVTDCFFFVFMFNSGITLIHLILFKKLVWSKTLLAKSRFFTWLSKSVTCHSEMACNQIPAINISAHVIFNSIVVSHTFSLQENLLFSKLVENIINSPREGFSPDRHTCEILALVFV